MDTSNIAIYGLGGTALFGLLSIILQSYVSRASKKPKDEKPKIKNLEKEQEILVTQLTTAQNVSEESKEEISEIVRIASKKIQETLNTESIKNIDKKLDEGWDKL